jgi:hypothetical protein
MSTVDSRGVLPADSSIINPEFIRRLQEQRDLHKREAAFYLAQAEKHGAADEALVSMIQVAEKIVAILFPVGVKAADAPDEATTESVSSHPGWTEATMAIVPKAAIPPTYNEPPATYGLEDLISDDPTGKSGNMWRTRLLGSRP